MRSGLALALALASALASSSCSAPASCNAQQGTADSPSVESEEIFGSLLLSAADDGQTLRFRATLSDLPELLTSDGARVGSSVPDAAVQGGAVQSGALSLELGLRYENEPFGGDGRTEMPRLALTFSDDAGGSSTAPATSNYPGPTPSNFLPGLFEACVLGARHCETTLDVRIQRLDGAPFPPLRVSFGATAKARLSACSVLTRETHATLEVEAP